MTQYDAPGGASGPLGVTPIADGVEVRVFSAHAEAIEVCIFDAQGETEVTRAVLPGRTGDIFHGVIGGIGEGTRYGLRAHGRFAPREGHRFNPSKLLLDPYATKIDRVPRLDASMFGQRQDDRLAMDDTDSAAAMPKAIIGQPAEAKLGLSLTPWSRSVVYELHVRGFTKRHPDIPEAIRGTFAGLAHPAAVTHLQALGVTAVEIMPANAWIEERHLAARGITNYWGYNTIGLLAPDPRLAPGGWAEVRACVAVLAAAGIETIIDVVFNHTGEGDDLGPTLSLRGLDNATYFRTVAGAPERYVDDCGCGNTVALDRPAPLRLAMDSLRAWARFGGVHGFRFDLATVLGRRPDGFDRDGPLLQAIEQDPILSRLKMIAEPWDVGWGGYQLGQFPKRWGEWNDRFRDDIRRFWQGEPARLGALATRIAGSEDAFAGRAPSRSVNFITAHDGFTLADLVAYTAKHNAANGENNRDGTDANFSWNNGAEGPSDNPAIQEARAADQRALLASLLLARGTPMLAMGAEFGHSQGGNNNAYAQDNETAWLDWARADPALLTWTQLLLAIRATHEGFRDDRFLTPNEAAWHRPDGAPMTDTDWNAADGQALVLLIKEPSPVCLVFNRGEVVPVTLPDPAQGCVWHLLADSAAGAQSAAAVFGTIEARRGVLALAEMQDDRPGTRQMANAETLDRLAVTAGVALEWWETYGTYHRVSDETKRAVLRAMHLPAETQSEARDSLARFADLRDHRALPMALVRRVGEALHLPMALPAGLSPRSEWLTIALEDSSQTRIRASAADAQVERFVAADGRAAQRWHVTLPDLPIGRHRAWRESAPESACFITIAPESSYLPASLANGGRRWGVSAQLYTLRTETDQGIGDFSTLRALARGTRAAGGAVVGLNPMHTLFAAERGRASPYQPSDRRFLDPIYLDLPEVSGPDGRALSAQAAVSYRGVWALKEPALEKRFRDAMHAPPDPTFKSFVDAGGTTLHRFAVFEALAEQHPGVSWHDWPVALRHPGTPEVATFSRAHADRVQFHQYLQFLCDQQLAAAAVPHAEGGLEIGFIRDLAVGCAPDGAEAWSMAELVGHHVSIGAPPDPFSAEGQVWGLPPPNPYLMAQNGYAAFAGLLEANLRYAGGLRIDHALGLARLFWVPDGGRGRDGTYVAYPFQDLLGQIALESHRARALVIGEDLGTVPDGLRDALSANDILSYRVLLLEREGRGFMAQAAYPSRAVACVSTHDLPTFAGWLEGADIAERVSLGQRLAADAAADMGERSAEVAELHTALGERTGNMLADAHAYVAETETDLVYVQADDLSGEHQAVNLPGTDLERPNWRRRLSVGLDDLFTNPVAAPVIAALKKARPDE